MGKRSKEVQASVQAAELVSELEREATSRYESLSPPDNPGWRGAPIGQDSRHFTREEIDARGEAETDMRACSRVVALLIGPETEIGKALAAEKAAESSN
jgi:hypothetical protein